MSLVVRAKRDAAALTSAIRWRSGQTDKDQPDRVIAMRTSSSRIRSTAKVRAHIVRSVSPSRSRSPPPDSRRACGHSGGAPPRNRRPRRTALRRGYSRHDQWTRPRHSAQRSESPPRSAWSCLMAPLPFDISSPLDPATHRGDAGTCDGRPSRVSRSHCAPRGSDGDAAAE